MDVPAVQRLRVGVRRRRLGSGAWRATFRANVANERSRQRHAGAGQRYDWRQFAGDVNGTLAGGFWTARVTGGSQDYFQTFSAIAADRQTERLNNDQTVPGNFVTAGGQWMRTWKAADVLVGAEGRQTTADINETRYPVVGAAVSTSIPTVEEQTASVYGRVRFTLRPDLSLVLGARGDHWKSTRLEELLQPAGVPHVARERPGVAAVLGGALVSHADAQRALSRLPRRQHRHQRQPAARARTADERRGRRARRPRPRVGRVTAFHNVLDEAISNITLSTTPALITRERQNADQLGSSGVEVEGDVRPHPRVTLSLFGAFTSAHYTDTPKQPAIQDNRVPQVPRLSRSAPASSPRPRGSRRSPSRPGSSARSTRTISTTLAARRLRRRRRVGVAAADPRAASVPRRREPVRRGIRRRPNTGAVDRLAVQRCAAGVRVFLPVSSSQRLFSSLFDRRANPAARTSNPADDHRDAPERPIEPVPVIGDQVERGAGVQHARVVEARRWRVWLRSAMTSARPGRSSRSAASTRRCAPDSRAAAASRTATSVKSSRAARRLQLGAAAIERRRERVEADAVQRHRRERVEEQRDR